MKAGAAIIGGILGVIGAFRRREKLGGALMIVGGIISLFMAEPIAVLPFGLMFVGGVLALGEE